MKKFTKTLLSNRLAVFVTLVGVVVCGCALPRPDTTQSFIAAKELDAIDATNRGLQYLHGGRYVEAEMAFRHVLFINPNIPSVRLNLALALSGVGLYDEALPILKELQATTPSAFSVNTALANIYVVTGQYRTAIVELDRHFEEAAALGELGVDRAVSYASILSRIYFLLGFEDLSVCYSDLAWKIRGEGDPITQFARSLLATDRSARAVDLLLPIGDPPTSPIFAHQLALASFGRRRFADARRYEEIAYSLRPPQDTVLNDNELQIVLTLSTLLTNREVGATKQELTGLIKIVANDREKEELQKPGVIVMTKLERDSLSTLIWPSQLLDTFRQATLPG